MSKYILKCNKPDLKYLYDFNTTVQYDIDTTPYHIVQTYIDSLINSDVLEKRDLIVLDIEIICIGIDDDCIYKYRVEIDTYPRKSIISLGG